MALSVRKLFIVTVLTLVGIFLAGTHQEVHALSVVQTGTVEITGMATPEGPDTKYSYTIINNTTAPGEQVFGFRLPFFDEESISIVSNSIMVPNAYWFFEFFAPNADGTWGYDPNADPLADSYGAPASAFEFPPFVGRFFTYKDPVLPYNTLSGFSFLSQFGAGNGPAVVELAAGVALTDPPQPITPNSPIPEPSTMLLLGSGLAGLGFFRMRRKREAK